MGVVAITITLIVYGVALAHLLDPDSWAYFSDVLLHRIVPVVAVLGWLIYGPRGLASRRVASQH